MGQNDRRSPIMNPAFLPRVLIAGLAAVVTAISPAGAQTALDKVSFGTNWVAEAEHGGFFQALADGTYKKYGLDVTIVPGGPNDNNRMLLIAGKLDFFMAADTLMSFDAVANNVPVVTVAAMFQKDPQIFLTHPESKITKLEDLKPLTLFVSKEGILGHEQRQRLEVFEFCDLRFRMGQEDLRILLEHGGDRHHWHIVGDRIERHQGVGGHEEVKLAGNQQHAVVVVRTARHDGDVEPVFFVGAVGQGLEKSAVLGLGNPVGSERDLVQRGLGARGRDGRNNGRQAGN